MNPTWLSGFAALLATVLVVPNAFAVHGTTITKTYVGGNADTAIGGVGEAADGCSAAAVGGEFFCVFELPAPAQATITIDDLVNPDVVAVAIFRDADRTPLDTQPVCTTVTLEVPPETSIMTVKAGGKLGSAGSCDGVAVAGTITVTWSTT